MAYAYLDTSHVKANSVQLLKKMAIQEQVPGSQRKTELWLF
jgi:hypothetical protein